MHNFKNKFICFILLLLIFSFAIPFYSYGVDDASYVWSEISSPIVTTSSVLSEGERKFFKPYLWKCHFN